MREGERGRYGRGEKPYFRQRGRGGQTAKFVLLSPTMHVHRCTHTCTHTQTHAYFKKDKGEGGKDERKTEGKEGKWAGISSLWAVKRKWPLVKGENQNST